MRGDDDEVAVVGELANELQHAVDLDVVEVRGRLVGEQHRRVVRERAGDRDALLLTAGEVGRAVVQAVFEIDLLQQRDRSFARLAPPDAGGAQRHHDVLERGQRRNQVERLEHDADGLAPVLGQRPAPQLGDFDPGDFDRARRRA